MKGELKKAIIVFESVIKKSSVKKETAALAQLHIGLCYEKLGKEKIANAVSSFKKVINLYPSEKDAVRIAKEKLAALNVSENDIQKIKNTIAEWNEAFESKDAERYCSFLSNQIINLMGGIQKVKRHFVNTYFSRWKPMA